MQQAGHWLMSDQGSELAGRPLLWVLGDSHARELYAATVQVLDRHRKSSLQPAQAILSDLTKLKHGALHGVWMRGWNSTVVGGMEYGFCGRASQKCLDHFAERVSE